MEPKILFRNSIDTRDEYDICKTVFPVLNYRSEISKGDFIIPRYSALPFYRELEQDVKNLGGQLIQSYAQHKYIADFDYYRDIADLTFETWRYGDTNIPDVPLVVKGVTNSKKWNWNTLMYAPNRQQAVKIACELGSDGLIGYQDIIFRRFEPLKKLETGLNGLPFSEEYRVFFLDGKIVSSGFYWAIAEDVDKPVPDEALIMAEKVADRVKEHTRFFVVDVAYTAQGKWICVELNCGTCSGLSMISPVDFYESLKRMLTKS